MELVKLTPYEFEEYASTNIMSSIYQTKEYERFLQENGFECDYIGLKDNYNRIIAASLIGYKKLINNYTYGYAPGGFLIDYKDTSLVKDFCKALSSYYKDKKMVFIKIIPNIIISKLDKETNEFKPNNNIKYIKLIKDAKAQELKSNKYFESILPKYRPLINLKTFQYSSLHKNVRNKIRNQITKRK